ncbi:MAG: ABC transporter substrate-binding protein, partial [Clostridia bacterium]|nr:ABC transporter substrate-binding protein [Clostridia bacterium]
MKRLIAAAVSLTLLTLCGCTFNKQNDMTSEKADTVTFTDDLKREVTVSKNPQKVAALIGSFADVWNLAGGSVCAAPDDAWSDFGLDIDGAVNIGGAHS